MLVSVLWLNILPLFFATSFFIYKRSRTYLLFFQQEEYENKHFIKWLIKKNFFDKKFTLALLLLTVCLSSLPTKWDIFLPYLFASLFFIFASLEKNPQQYAKKPLVFTSRALRIFILSNIITAGSFLLSLYLDFQFLAWKNLPIVLIVTIQVLPLMLVFANILLTPIEFFIQYKIIREAQKKLAKINPTIIGITGSYGKTSVKHILAHILSFHWPTLSTPGSVNTLMGISRIIREQLKPEHKIFIVEMGAYYKKSIEKLCQLTPPHYGILTAIGNVHYERFKNTLNIARAKFELVHAVLENEGKMIINVNDVNPHFIHEFVDQENFPQIITVGYHAEKKIKTPQISIQHVQENKTGITFELIANEKTYLIQAPLYGKHQALNIALAFSLAHLMGMSAEAIIKSISTLPQITHRLAVTYFEKNNITIIDNAYNSNPEGFKASLQLLQTLCPAQGRKILVTPGIVELGKLHHEVHYELGQLASQSVDLALIVSPHRIRSFIKGFLKHKEQVNKLLMFESFKAAKAWLDKHAKPGDVILYENDLTDLYETPIKI
jgi:UDP-N-acetylmuramoyl-tripeptide--D-alanyl-D-alanine ligase